nr:T9SS type A sorting domain-containing protein [Melioribacteraceae bacterium]
QILNSNVDNGVWQYPHGEQNEVSINSALTGDIDELYINSQYLGSFDYELRFTENENFAVDYWDHKTIISVPFELWNIGINTPDYNSDDLRMIPFVRMQKDTNSWRINSTFEPSSLFFEGYANPASDWIYWMKPDIESGGYNSFANICKSTGIGTEYNRTLDNSTQGFYVDFQGDFNYAMGNMLVVDDDKDGNPPNAETTIRFSTVKPVPEGETFTFTSEKFTLSFDLDNYALFQNYPNPFNPATTIRFYLPKDGLVTLTFYNVLGQKVDELLNSKMSLGLHEITFSNTNLASGIYLYRLKTEQFSETKKMILVK